MPNASSAKHAANQSGSSENFNGFFFFLMSKKAQSGGNLKRKNKPDRLEYLDQLVVEFQTTKQKSKADSLYNSILRLGLE